MVINFRCDIFRQEKKIDANATLLLPMLEQLFFWNIFSMSSNSPVLLQSFVDMIDQKIAMMQYPDLVDNPAHGIPTSEISTNGISNNESPEKPSAGTPTPNGTPKKRNSRKSSKDGTPSNNNKLHVSVDEKYLYLITMKGICYHYMKNHESEAQKLLSFVIENQINLNLYQHLAPLACLELGIIYSKSSDDFDLDIAVQYLNNATNEYKQYLNETMVHMRATAAINLIKDKRKIKKQSLELKRSQSAMEPKRGGLNGVKRDSLDSCHSVD